MTDPHPTVVVVAAETDLTADLVVSHLVGHATVLRLDPGNLDGKFEATGRFHTARWHSTLRHRERAAPVDEHCAVYWRKPTRPQAHADPDERWRADENTTALLGLLKAQPLRIWCNDPTTVSAARHKPAQLAAAARAGFTVPDTLLTSDPSAARAFIEEHDDRVVVKALTQRHTTFVPTTRLRRTDDPSAIAGTIHCLQALVGERRFDARVTVVDDRVFTAAITTDGHLDWRTAGTACHYTPIAAPADVEAACVDHVRDLGLTYAALDFVVDEHQWNYLETNPAGEFGFVQARTDLPIAREIAHLLVRGPRGRVRPFRADPAPAPARMSR
ncbi:hypothetical protein [Embleya sp. NBC_00896]|uniref:hypothetical protein n=1 Tax=Embleya sp. NBC_00896 TaxID=2975961 RepID=UPI002F914AF2|nr:hypothetical protein OG928_46810 [Embleya sp. NBC_00896]